MGKAQQVEVVNPSGNKVTVNDPSLEFTLAQTRQGGWSMPPAKRNPEPPKGSGK